LRQGTEYLVNNRGKVSWPWWIFEITVPNLPANNPQQRKKLMSEARKAMQSIKMFKEMRGYFIEDLYQGTVI
jgi:hypothetical protein